MAPPLQRRRMPTVANVSGNSSYGNSIVAFPHIPRHSSESGSPKRRLGEKRRRTLRKAQSRFRKFITWIIRANGDRPTGQRQGQLRDLAIGVIKNARPLAIRFEFVKQPISPADSQAVLEWTLELADKILGWACHPDFDDVMTAYQEEYEIGHREVSTSTNTPPPELLFVKNMLRLAEYDDVPMVQISGNNSTISSAVDEHEYGHDSFPQAGDFELEINNFVTQAVMQS